MSSKTEEISYDDAMKELESILVAMEEEEIGIDELGPRVERAAELIVLCRAKLERTGTQVRDALRSLSEAGEDAGSIELGADVPPDDASGR